MTKFSSPTGCCRNFYHWLHQKVRCSQWFRPNDDISVFQAKYVILALTPSLHLKINFTPALSSHRTQLIQRVPMGSVIKTNVFYKKAFWLEKGKHRNRNVVILTLSSLTAVEVAKWQLLAQGVTKISTKWRLRFSEAEGIKYLPRNDCCWYQFHRLFPVIWPCFQIQPPELEGQVSKFYYVYVVLYVWFVEINGKYYHNAFIFSHMKDNAGKFAMDNPHRKQSTGNKLSLSLIILWSWSYLG